MIWAMVWRGASWTFTASAAASSCGTYGWMLSGSTFGVEDGLLIVRSLYNSKNIFSRTSKTMTVHRVWPLPDAQREN
jgi:hypothetical protein